MPRVIALTGATGFIGSVIAGRLLSEGFRVRALVRSCSAGKCWYHPGLAWVTGDIGDKACLTGLLKGADVMINCAGAVRGMTSRDFQAVNTVPLEILAQICNSGTDVFRLLYISSLAARHPELSHYASSKRKGEEALMAMSSRVMWTIFRPPAVYGPGDREIRPMFQLMKRGIAFTTGGGRNRFSLLHVHDLAEAVFYWLNSEPVSGKLYELHDGFQGGYSWEDVVSVAERAFRRRIVKIPLAQSMLTVAGFLNAAAARLHGRPPMLTPGKARELAHGEWVCDNRQISRDTGWKPGLILEDALRRGCF